MTATDELLPCPFCGGGAELRYHPSSMRDPSHRSWEVGCSICDARVGSTVYAIGKTRDEAIAAWNRRANEATLGRRGYTYEQWRAISDAMADAMKYAHDKAIEYPDKADPYWNLDEYVERVLKTAFGDEATLGRGECHDEDNGERFVCSECGCRLDLLNDDLEPTMWVDGFAVVPSFCPNCGRRVVEVDG